MINYEKAPKAKNKYRLTLGELAEEYGYENKADFLMNECQDSVVPACCSEGCETEPDGRCEHGCPSALLATGMI